MIEISKIEFLEHKYLRKINSTLDQHLDNIIKELHSMNKISKYWENIPYDEGIDSGAERVIYSKLHSGAFGTPNSAPVASDLFFENPEAFIHIDLKSNQPHNNLSDHWRIPIGPNQNSYRCYIKPQRGAKRLYEPNLPPFYGDKVCLTYFISILYSKFDNQVKIININTSCVPNGKLVDIYGDDIFGPGKNPEKIHKSGKIEKTKARYLVMNNLNFEKLNTKNKTKRTLISYEDEKLIDDLPEHYDYKITKGKKRVK